MTTHVTKLICEKDVSPGVQRGEFSPLHLWCPECQVRLTKACKITDEVGCHIIVIGQISLLINCQSKVSDRDKHPPNPTDMTILSVFYSTSIITGCGRVVDKRQ